MNHRSLLNWFMSPIFDNYNMSQYDTMNIARMICNGKTNIGKQHVGDYKAIHVPNIDTQIYTENEFLKPIIEIKNILEKENNKYIKHVLLHGSLADLNYVIGWSDLDTLVVISDHIFEDASSLFYTRNLFYKLNKLLLKIDPIAHHGFIIVLESDLDNYNDSFIPIEVINEARSIYGPCNINIRKSNYTIDWVNKFEEMKSTFVDFSISGIFKHHPYKGEYLTKEMIQQNEGMYQFKYLIGSVMIIPSLYYSAIGSPVYKSKSFEPFFKIFPNSLSIIKCVSKIRSDWEKLEKHPYKPNRIPFWLLERLPQDYNLQIIRLLDNIINDIKTKQGAKYAK